MGILPALLLTLVSVDAAVWLPPRVPGVRLVEEKRGTWKITSSSPREFTLESDQALEARPGDAFAINLGIRVGISTRALPELVCFDTDGREIPSRSSLATGPDIFTTNWQRLKRVFPVLPGTARVRARLRAAGQGDVWISDLEFRPEKINPYQTGALISQLYPNRRRGLVLESNRSIANGDLVTRADTDGDGKWALVSVDLDAISQPEGNRQDWRTGFEYRPNEIYWSEGAVLKSDSVSADRDPNRARALHFRARVRPGPYRARLNDPGRAIAVSLDGATWKRYPGGAEADLGTINVPDGVLDFWVDACYRDPVTVGPAYFDYVRLFPAPDPASEERLFAAARRQPRRMVRGTVERNDVPVAVQGSRFAGGANWPVRCGIPIPQGQLVRSGNASVFDKDGRQLPSENHVMATWPDGSIKWLYLDFFHDFSASVKGRYTIRYGNRVDVLPPPSGIRIRQTVSGLVVDTGAIRFEVSKTHFGLIEKVTLASGRVVQTQPVSAEIIEATGNTWSALDLPVEKLAVEQVGPLHAVILAETKMAARGSPSQGFFHRARIHAYAGSPLVQVDYFVANTDSRNEVRPGWLGSHLPVKSVTLRVRTASPVTGVVHPLGKEEDRGALVQKTADTILTGSGAAARQSSGHLSGWAAFEQGSGASLSIGVEAFREQFPKAIRWRPDEIEIALWAEEGGVYEWNEGVGKTHRVSFYYGSHAAPDSQLLAAGPVLALAEPEWYTGSGAFGPMLTAAGTGRPPVEANLAASMKGVVERVGLGFEDYGDHSSPGYVRGTVAWANNEYDQPWANISHFARTGDTDALRIGLASALHYLDVDIGHYSSIDPDWVGAPRVHGHGVIGHHTAEAPNMHHAGYVQGLILYTYLTGDPAGIAGAESIARWVLKKATPETTVGSMERALGHPLMTLTDVYEATWDETYLRGAAKLTDWALKWEHPDRSGFLAPITESPGFYSGSPFCGGLLPYGLLKFNSWARLPEVDRMLERSARWLLTEMWRPPGRIIHKGGPPRASAGANARHISSYLPLMAHVYSTTDDPLFLAVPAASVEQAFGAGSRPFSYRNSGLVFDYLPWFLKTLADNGNPTADAEVEVRAPAEVHLSRGRSAEACFTVRNAGEAPVENLKLSFQTRLELKAVAASAAPVQLGSGEEKQVCFSVEAPDWLNLTSEAGRTAYGHLSASFSRVGNARLVNGWTEIVIEP